LQASGYADVTVQVEDHEDVGDGGETVALSIQENSASFMDDFFKQVINMVMAVNFSWPKIGKFAVQRSTCGKNAEFVENLKSQS